MSSGLVSKTGGVSRGGGLIRVAQPSPAGQWDPQWQDNVVDFDRDQFTRFIADKGYCVDPSVLILRSNLTWVPAEDVRVGEELLGFDEFSPGPKLHRRLRPAVVEAKKMFISPRVRVYTDKGAVIVSADHRFLATGYVRPRPTRYGWVPAARLKSGAQIMYFAAPWSTDTSRDAGWLAGMYDGEGCLPNRKGFVELSVYQKRGIVESRLRDEISRRGFLTAERVDPKTDVFAFKTNAIEDVAHLIGSIRPIRMLAAFRDRVGRGHYPANCRSSAVVQHVEPIEDDVVVALQTNTRTLITDGFLSHNCVTWEKAVLCPNVTGGGLSPRDHAIGCPFCDERGFIYVDPIKTRMLMQGIRLNQSFFAYGQWDAGNMLVTAEPEFTVDRFDRLTLGNGVGRFTQRVTRRPGATTDKLKYAPLCFHFVGWVDRSSTLVSFTQDVDFRVSADGSSVEWPGASQPDAGSTYSVCYDYRPRYVALDLVHQHRDSTVDGQHYQFPVQAIAKLDYLIRNESTDPQHAVDRNPFE